MKRGRFARQPLRPSGTLPTGEELIAIGVDAKPAIYNLDFIDEIRAAWSPIRRRLGRLNVRLEAQECGEGRDSQSSGDRNRPHTHAVDEQTEKGGPSACVTRAGAVRRPFRRP